MKLVARPVAGWPKLAWAARFAAGGEAVEVLHGPMVEWGDGWCAEAVWAGTFAVGDFDRTDLVFGSGVRVRGREVTFVSAGTMLDRLWHCRRGGRFYVSNSLPAIMACADLALLDDHDYNRDVKTMREGLNRYQRDIPTTSGPVRVVYYHSLLYDGREMKEVAKPETTPGFRCFADYRDFLFATARQLGRNLASPDRAHRIRPLASVSSGYDSGAAAVVAREAGCTDAVTIANASSLLPRSDSGLDVARHLDLACRAYRHTSAAYRREKTVWAVAGRPAGLNLTVFDYPSPLCLFFTGYRGDTVWARAITDWSQPFATPSIAGLGLCEFRLHQGVFHCVVPFCGSRRVNEIQALNFLPEMAPWTLRRDYDRPIPRRLLEEAGVPRRLFGIRKEVTSAESFFLWPFARRNMASFAAFLRGRGLYAPSDLTVGLLRKLVHLDHLVYVNLTHRLGWHRRGLRFWLKLRGQGLLFQWANEALRQAYERPLRALRSPGGAADGRSEAG
jgi:hypothetical protein